MRCITNSIIAVVLLCCAGCGQDVGPLPKPAGLPVEGRFPFEPAPPCSVVVGAAFSKQGPAAILRAARAGASFSCAIGDRPLLAQAIEAGDVDRVATLLEAHADPNIRWMDGYYFPLQRALDLAYGGLGYNQTEIIALLLAHGANPNVRGCPFESRCTAPEGYLPMTLATRADDIPAMRMLLDSGADPNLDDLSGGPPLHSAHSEAAVALLLPRMFPKHPAPEKEALRRLEASRDPDIEDGPWMETALIRAILYPPFHSISSMMLPHVSDPVLPPVSNSPDLAALPNAAVDVLLRLGADPNRRLTKRADWTPLAMGLARAKTYPSLADTLLDYGADPNGRWCSSMRWDKNGDLAAEAVRPAACSLPTGTTPLMFAATRCDAAQITTLLEHGADASLRDWTGRTARDRASGCKGNVLKALVRGR